MQQNQLFVLTQQPLSKQFLPTTESNLRTALGVEICKFGYIIARIWKSHSRWVFVVT